MPHKRVTRRDGTNSRIVSSCPSSSFRSNRPPSVFVRLPCGTRFAIAHAPSRLSVCPKLRFVPLLAAGLLAACAPRPGAESAPTRNASTPPTSARNVTFAVENGYVPFNFIRTNTRAAEGWDYAVAAELGRRLSFTPVFR